MYLCKIMYISRYLKALNIQQFLQCLKKLWCLAFSLYLVGLYTNALGKFLSKYHDNNTQIGQITNITIYMNIYITFHGCN